MPLPPLLKINKKQSAPGGRAIEWISFSIRDLNVNRCMLPKGINRPDD
jgi:hypothetical protein